MLIPFINGYRRGRLGPSIWIGWPLSFIGTLMMSIKPSEWDDSDSPTAFGYLIVGWAIAMMFHGLGYASRDCFDGLRRLFSRRPTH